MLGTWLTSKLEEQKEWMAKQKNLKKEFEQMKWLMQLKEQTSRFGDLSQEGQGEEVGEVGHLMVEMKNWHL